MVTKLRIEDAWSRIRSLARQKGPRLVAVPFVGSGACRRLVLRRGDILVTRCDVPTVRAGLTHPREIVQYIKKGVEVHSATALHAKVFVLGSSAIIGSTNVSATSETGLIEAAVETDNRAVVRECSDFVRSLRGDIIELGYARRLISEYRPPRVTATGKRGPRRIRRTEPGQSPLWIVGLQPCAYEDEDKRESTKAQRKAHRRIQSVRRFRIDEFLWMSGKVPFREGDRVVMCTEHTRGQVLVDPQRVF